MTMHISCASCGVEFCLPDGLHAARRKDGRSFWCPNGHSLSFSPTRDEKRIAELEQQLAAAERVGQRRLAHMDDLTAAREDLVGALRECPGGCGWRSRRQVPRDPVAMGRGIERVRRDVAEHLVEAHGARPVMRELAAGS
jgi:hypothetical protein